MASPSGGEAELDPGSISMVPIICRVMTLTVLTGILACELFAHETERPARVPDEVAHRPTAIPDRIVLTWHGDPATTMAVTWRTDSSVKHAIAEVQLADHGPLFTMNSVKVDAVTTPLETNLGVAHFHSGKFESLKPKTKYAYRVGDGLNWSEWNHFTTASDKAEPFSFVYFGDAQNDVKSQWSRVVREAYSDVPKAAFMVHAGDLINRGTNDAEWGDWFYASGHIHRMTPCVPTPGNHEYSKVNNAPKLTPHWQAMFTLPEHGPKGLAESTYWMDYQGTRLVSLNSNEKQEDQVAWLTEVLSSNPAKWTILTFHHPIYSSSRGRDNKSLRELWQPVIDKFRVDLVLQGHDHTYARSGLMTHENVATGTSNRSDNSGTVYVVSVSGPKMYSLDREPFMIRAAENTQLYQIIHVDGEELRYSAYTANGTPYDEFILRKRAGQVNELIDKIPAMPERRQGNTAVRKAS